MEQHRNGVINDINALNELESVIDNVQRHSALLLDTNSRALRSALYDSATQYNSIHEELSKLQAMESELDSSLAELDNAYSNIKQEITEFSESVENNKNIDESTRALSEEIMSDITGCKVQKVDNVTKLTYKDKYQLVIDSNTSSVTVSCTKWNDNGFHGALLNSAQTELDSIVSHYNTDNQTTAIQRCHVLITRLLDISYEIERLQRDHTVQLSAANETTPVCTVTITSVHSMQQLVVPFVITADYPYNNVLPQDSNIIIISALRSTPTFTNNHVYDAVNTTKGLTRLAKIVKQLTQIVSR